MKLKKLLDILNRLEPILEKSQIFVQSNEDGIYDNTICIFEDTEDSEGNTIKISL